MPNFDLIDTLRNVDAVQYGEFELSHAGTSEYYIDKYLYETDPECLSRIAQSFAARLDTTKLAGVALGAVPLVVATSLETKLPSVIVRKKQKEYGSSNRIEGKLTEGEEVVVIEDVAMTGQSALNAVAALREAGAVVNRVLVIVDREEGARERLAEHDIELDALLTTEDLLADV